jgi:FHA domain
MAKDDLTLETLFFSEEDTVPGRAHDDSGHLPDVTLKETLTDLPDALIAGVSDEVMKNLRGALDINLADVVLEGWGKYKELLQYRDRKRYPPDQTILLPLAHHEIRSVHKPYVDVLLDDKPIGRVTFTVDLRLLFDGVILTIRDATIWEVKAGTCEGRGALKCGAIELVNKRIVKFDLPGRINLPDGFPIPAGLAHDDTAEDSAPADQGALTAGPASAPQYSHAAVYRLGRLRDNDFVIDDRTVSRHHALLSVGANGALHVTDLESTGGTFVRTGDDWTRFVERDVEPDTQLRFGDYEVAVVTLLANLTRVEGRRAG